MKKIAIFLAMFFVSLTLCSVGVAPTNYSVDLSSKQSLLNKGKIITQNQTGYFVKL